MDIVTRELEDGPSLFYKYGDLELPVPTKKVRRGIKYSIVESSTKEFSEIFGCEDKIKNIYINVPLGFVLIEECNVPSAYIKCKRLRVENSKVKSLKVHSTLLETLRFGSIFDACIIETLYLQENLYAGFMDSIIGVLRFEGEDAIQSIHNSSIRQIGQISPYFGYCLSSFTGNGNEYKKAPDCYASADRWIMRTLQEICMDLIGKKEIDITPLGKGIFDDKILECSRCGYRNFRTAFAFIYSRKTVVCSNVKRCRPFIPPF